MHSTTFLRQRRIWHNVIAVICNLQCRWLLLFISDWMFSYLSTVAQECRASSDGLRQALAQVPVFPGKALLPDTECSSGTVCTFISHYHCMWSAGSLLSTLLYYNKSAWLPVLRRRSLSFSQGTQRKWHLLWCGSVKIFSCLIVVIFRHCLLPLSLLFWG